MKKCYLSIIILLSLNVQAEHVFKANPKGYQGSLVFDPYFTESDFIFKEYNPLPWTELERNLSVLTPLISNQTTNFIQNGTATILQERIIQHIYTNTKINTDVVRQTSKEQQTITEPATQNVIVTKTNSLETENKSNCTEWTPATDTKFTDETVEQNQECDVQTVDTYSYSIDGNVVEQKDLNGTIRKTFEQEVEGTKPLVFSSCKEILDAGRSTGDGSYTLTENSNSFSTNCDMTNGGLTQIDNSLFDINKIKNEEQIVKTTEFISVSGVPIGTPIISISYNDNIKKNILKNVSSPLTLVNYVLHSTTNHWAVNGQTGYSYIDSHGYFASIGHSVSSIKKGVIVFSNGYVGKIEVTSNGSYTYRVPNNPLYDNGEPAYIYYHKHNYTLWKK